MCSCQAYGKSGVPNDRGFCLVCGELVIDRTKDVPDPCPVFRPDHNGECLNCDEWLDAHTPEAIALGEQLAAGLVEDRCQVCGRLIGIGIPLMHLGLCEECKAQKES